jgi:hypothetical protein
MLRRAEASQRALLAAARFDARARLFTDVAAVRLLGIALNGPFLRCWKLTRIGKKRHGTCVNALVLDPDALTWKENLAFPKGRPDCNPGGRSYESRGCGCLTDQVPPPRRSAQEVIAARIRHPSAAPKVSCERIGLRPCPGNGSVGSEIPTVPAKMLGCSRLAWPIQ